MNEKRTAVFAKRAATVSVVIPNLNSPVVGEVVDAVARQGEDSSDVEVIVVGRDDAGLLAGRRAVNFVRTPQPMLPGAARNLGASIARGEQIIFLDADCIPQPGWLATLRRHQAAHDCIVSGAMLLEDENYWLLSGNIAGFRENLCSRPPAARSYLASFSLAGRRSVFLASGGFDDRYYPSEDLDLTARLYVGGHRLCFEPGARVVHRPSRQSLRALLSYAPKWGGNSIRVRARYPRAFGTPRLAFNWPALLVLSPLLAAASTAQTFGENADLRRYWRTAPAVFLLKLVSALSASRTLRRRKADGC